MRVAGLFAGIGGIELGLERAGHTTELLCENDPAAKAVLAKRFPDAPLMDDIRSIRSLPKVDLVAAGFPCQDLSQAGTTNGIDGAKSGLVKALLQLIAATPRTRRPEWILIENVPFMLQLARGRAIRYVTDELGRLGYLWAYRVVDTRAFGLPHRRRRVLLLASRSGDPRAAILAKDRGEPESGVKDRLACGFYWTEGNRGLGWAVDAIPPLKGSSGLGIPSPPGIWLPDGRIVVPDIRDAERLQGFRANWTRPAAREGSRGIGARWRLVGNAVSVPISEWIGQRVKVAEDFDPVDLKPLLDDERWPAAAWGKDGKIYPTHVSAFPVRRRAESIDQFLRFPVTPLSTRAAQGFLARLKASGLRVPDQFITDLEGHVEVGRVGSPEAKSDVQQPIAAA